MSAAKHTPGPWSAGVRSGNFIDITHSNNQPGAITRALCRVQARQSWVAEAEANARLIAAAPELLAALEAMLEQLSKGPYAFKDSGALYSTRSAVEKATGEQP